MSTRSFHPDNFAYGDPDKLRAIIAGLMEAIAIRCNIAGDYAYLRSDASLQYTLECAAAEFRAALNILADLRDQTRRSDERSLAPEPRSASQKRTGP